MEKIIDLNKENVIVLRKEPSYRGSILSIMNDYLKNDDLIKGLDLCILDDIIFNAYSEDRNVNMIDFDININHPFYFCVKHLLNEEKELIIDDDDTHQRLKKYLIIKKADDAYKFIFINNLENKRYIDEKFRVFIKNVNSDIRSKITDYSIKGRIIEFFKELEEILLEDYHQITLEEYLEINKDKKKIKIR